MAHGEKLSKQQLDGLKKFNEKTKEELTCSICLDYFEDPVTTRCDHEFCRQCILKCMSLVNLLCPVCKNKISKRSLVTRNNLAAIARDVKDISAELPSLIASAEAIEVLNVEMKTKMKTPMKPVIAENPRRVPRSGPRGLTLLTQLDNEFRVEQQRQQATTMGSSTISLEHSADSVQLLPYSDNEHIESSECLLSASQIVPVVSHRKDAAQAEGNAKKLLPKEELAFEAKMENWFTSCGKHLLDCNNPMVELEDNLENSEPGVPLPWVQERRLFKSYNGQPLPDETKVPENGDRQQAADPYLFVSSQKTPQKLRKRLSADQQRMSYSRVDLKRYFKLKACDSNRKNEKSNEPPVNGHVTLSLSARAKKPAKECSDSKTDDSFPISVGDAFDELVAQGPLRHFPTVNNANSAKTRLSSSPLCSSSIADQRTIILFGSPKDINDEARRMVMKKETVGTRGRKRKLKDAVTLEDVSVLKKKPVGQPKNVKRAKIAATVTAAAGAQEQDRNVTDMFNPIPSTSKQTERTDVVIPPMAEQESNENRNFDVPHNSIEKKCRPTSLATTVTWKDSETSKDINLPKLNVELENKEVQTASVSDVVLSINAERATADSVFVPGEEIPVQLHEALMVVEPREAVPPESRMVNVQPCEELLVEACVELPVKAHEVIIKVCHQTSREPSRKSSSIDSSTTEHHKELDSTTEKSSGAVQSVCHPLNLSVCHPLNLSVCHPLNLSVAVDNAQQVAESTSAQNSEKVLQASQSLNLSKKNNRECNEGLLRMLRNTHSPNVDRKDVRDAEQEEEEEVEEEEEISFLARIKLRRSLTSAPKSCRPKVKFYLHKSMRHMTVVKPVSSKGCQTDSSLTFMSGLDCVCRLASAVSPLAQVTARVEQKSVPVESEDCVVQVASESWGETQLPLTENLPMLTDQGPDEAEVEHKSEQLLSMQVDVPEKIAVEKLENINLPVFAERSHVCVTPVVDTKNSTLKDSDKEVYSPSPVQRTTKRCFINDFMAAPVVVPQPLEPPSDLPVNSQEKQQDSEEMVAMSSLKKSILRSKIVRMRTKVSSDEDMEETKQLEPVKGGREKFKRIILAPSSDTEFSVGDHNKSNEETSISLCTSDDNSDSEFKASNNVIEQALRDVLPETEELFDDFTPSLLEVISESDGEISFDYDSSQTALARVKDNYKRDLELLRKAQDVDTGDVLPTNVETLDLGLSGNTRAAEYVQAKQEQCTEMKLLNDNCVAADVGAEDEEPDLFPESITECHETNDVSNGNEEDSQDVGCGMVDQSVTTQFPYSDISTETEYLNTQCRKQLEREIMAEKAAVRLMEQQLKAESARHDAASQSTAASGNDFHLVDCLNDVAVSLKTQTPLSPLKATVPIEHSPLSTVPAIKDRVFVTSGLSQTQQANVKTMALMFNCKLADAVTRNITHLIIKTDEKKMCLRTFKYLMAVACHCYIVSYEWVNACVTSGVFILEDDYEVVGDSSTSSVFHSGPRNSRLSALPLFKNHEIHSIGLINGINKDDWFQLLNMSGATHITDPSLFSYMRNRKSYILVTHNSGVDEDYNKLYQRYRVPVLDQDWILNSLASYNLNPIEGYLLTSNGI